MFVKGIACRFFGVVGLFGIVALYFYSLKYSSINCIKNILYMALCFFIVSCSSVKTVKKTEINFSSTPSQVGVYVVNEGDVLYEEKTLKQVFEMPRTETENKKIINDTDIDEEEINKIDIDSLPTIDLSELLKHIIILSPPKLVDEKKVSSRKLVYLNAKEDGSRLLYESVLPDGKKVKKVYLCSECVNSNGYVFDVDDIKIRFFKEENGALTYSILSAPSIANSRLYQVIIDLKVVSDSEWRDFSVIKERKGEYTGLSYYKNIVVDSLERLGMIHKEYQGDDNDADGTIVFSKKTIRPKPRHPSTEFFDDKYTYIYRFVASNKNIDGDRIRYDTKWIANIRVEVASGNSRKVIEDVLPLLIEMIKENKTNRLFGSYNACDKNFIKKSRKRSTVVIGEPIPCTDKAIQK